MTRTVEEAVADLASPDAIVRDQALGLVVSYGRRATAALLPLVDGQDPALRARAVRGLGEIADSTTADRLFELVDDGDPEVRAHAAAGLARMKDPRALDALIKTFDDRPHLTMVQGTPATDALMVMGEAALPRVAALLAAPSQETRDRARFVILAVASRLPPAEAAAWRAKVAAAESGP
ncbi:MAG: hypothetical protein E6J90_41285 [Deltaproteobacteria bacterium]|nr:MAG: hypothetical protein E6J90_41285 [Deltaproteobacteria bacterium]TMQ16898.1 MAG: hypothetical protein E6J91_10970 [Deltaproteobacteria bacterium]